MAIELDQPRFRGSPPICPSANLPAFDDRASLAAFLKANCPSHVLDQVWTCEACRKIHHRGHFPGPSGASSGTSTRHETLIIPAEIRASIRRRAEQRRAALAKPVKGRKEKELSMV
jgi:hypothetical protein